MIWAAIIIPGLFSLAAAGLGLINHGKIADTQAKVQDTQNKVQEVHVLVNSRLDATLSEIADLKQQRDLKASGESGERLQP
jgi:hypothetical protein